MEAKCWALDVSFVFDCDLFAIQLHKMGRSL
jgi:hypothetical protein